MGLQPENREERGHAGLYIHVPFCVRKCLYCDFYSVTELQELDTFLAALMQEMDLVTPPGGLFDTIYMGGGTPSVLKGVQVLKVLEGAHRRFAFTQDVEVTKVKEGPKPSPEELERQRHDFLAQLADMYVDGAAPHHYFLPPDLVEEPSDARDALVPEVPTFLVTPHHLDQNQKIHLYPTDLSFSWKDTLV